MLTPERYSLTQTLLDLSIPSFDTLLAKSRVKFSFQWKNCSNNTVEYLNIWRRNKLVFAFSLSSRLLVRLSACLLCGPFSFLK